MTTQIFKDSDILKQLEWPLIQEHLRSLSHFENTASKRITPDNVYDIKVEETFNLTEIFVDQLYDDSYIQCKKQLQTLSSSESFYQNTLRLQKSAILDISELNQVALSVEFFLNNYKLLLGLSLTEIANDDFHKIKRYFTNNFLKDFRTFVETDGTVDYLKHPRLRLLYKKQIELESKIRKSLSGIQMDNNVSKALQFSGHDIINDRYVIAIKTDAYTSKFGQIIARSDSGQTLFIEPGQIKQNNYERLQLVLEFQKEITSLTSQYSKALTERLDDLFDFDKILFKFDDIDTRAHFATSLGLTRPEILDEPGMNVIQMFHPLIQNPIKNDLFLDQSKNGLIISGPNTGGKTASLKTIVFIQLFAHFGLFVPASKAQVHLYKKIFYFGNDQQSLPEGLSSFAAEVENYSELFDTLDESNLIVIDEIFNSTSSEEASALAVSLFNEIHKVANAHFLVSTHHQMLKTLTHQNDEYISCHVGFDPDSKRPTYKLIYGLPGSSQALNIFQLLTEDNEINKAIFDNSLKILDKKMVSYEALLEKVSKKEVELDRLILKNSDLKKQLKNQKSSMEGIYKLKLAEKVEKAEGEIKKITIKADKLISEIKIGNITKHKNLAKKSHGIQAELRIMSPIKKQETVRDEKYQHLKSPANIIVGNSYFSTFLYQTVKIKSVNLKKGIAMVTKGLMTISCPVDSLRETNETKTAPMAKDPQVSIHYQKDSSATIEYDCRGMRLEEFEHIVHNAISDLLAEKVPFVNIIHGHGTGVLKSWLRKMIKTQKDIRIDPSESGNDGETRIIVS